MQPETRRRLLVNSMAAGLGTWAFPTLAAPRQYICPPCGCTADGRRFGQAGVCPACGMKLVLTTNATASIFEPRVLDPGAGQFEMAAGPARIGARLTVHYYRPQSFTSDSPVLIDLAGAGRNAGTYSDAWIAEADRACVLNAAPSYP